MSEFATADQLPALLREPPWLGASRAAEAPQLALPPLVQAPRMRWSEKEREAALVACAQSSWDAPRPLGPGEAKAFVDSVVRPEARERLQAGVPLQTADLVDPLPVAGLYLRRLLGLPAELAIGLWNAVPPTRWNDGFDVALGSLLARLGAAAAPGLIAYAARRPVQGLRVGRWLDCPELASLALKVLRGLKIARQPATDWLLTHPGTTAGVLLRQLFGADDAAREDARSALHLLAASGLRQALGDAARDLGDAVQAALNAELNADPLLRLPAHMPKLPGFFDPARLHRPRLRSNGAALPHDAVAHIALMLAISRPQQPYAGLDIVRAACMPASLAEFVWDLFEAWWAAGASSKDAWALPALGLLGDDGTAHRMGPRAMRLAKEGAKQRALALVELLAEAGSDAGLMHLNNLADRCKAPLVRNRAAALVDTVAQQRGLSRLELADRLVPTLGLDESRMLDFGPRQFLIGLDEALTPYVKDAQGVRLKDLPKPRQSDDAAQAQAATLRFKVLKSELRSLGKVQVARLEQAMVAQRHWSLDDFQTFFVQHSLTRELAARLLWGVHDESLRLIGACRIAEDGTLADVRDERYEPPPQARFGIAHPLRLPLELREAFGQQFGDYEILQPFPQLGRETFGLKPGEAAGSRLSRVDGRDIATGAAIGLLDRDWLRGPAFDGGMITTLVKPIGPAGLQAVLRIEPGMPVWRLSAEPRQTLGPVLLEDADSRAAPFGAIDPVACSELLRDLYRLAPFEP
jgi:hypothetical protein